MALIQMSSVEEACFALMVCIISIYISVFFFLRKYLKYGLSCCSPTLFYVVLFLETAQLQTIRHKSFEDIIC